MIKRIPRRTKSGQDGYDARGIIVVDARNDGSEVKLVTNHPVPQVDENFYYDQLIYRLASSYQSRFAG